MSRFLPLLAAGLTLCVLAGVRPVAADDQGQVAGNPAILLAQGGPPKKQGGNPGKGGGNPGKGGGNPGKGGGNPGKGGGNPGKGNPQKGNDSAGADDGGDPGQNGQDGDGGSPKAADCSSAGDKAQSQTGGQVLSVNGSGGSCSVTVLVPGEGGGRPRKQTITVQP